MCVGSGLCTQLGFMHTQLYSCIHNSVLKALVTWEWACIRVVLSAYMGLDLRTWDVWQRPYFAHFHSFFDCFTPICNPNNSFLSFLHLNVTVSFFLSSFFYQNIIFFSKFCLNQESNVIFLFLQPSFPYVGRGSTNKVVEWCNLLVPKTRAYIWEAGFEPIIDLLLKKYVSATSVQCLIERWWDTTHTFHIVKREMIVTPYDLYHMTGLSFKGAIISLDGMSASN